MKLSASIWTESNCSAAIFSLLLSCSRRPVARFLWVGVWAAIFSEAFNTETKAQEAACYLLLPRVQVKGKGGPFFSTTVHDSVSFQFIFRRCRPSSINVSYITVAKNSREQKSRGIQLERIRVDLRFMWYVVGRQPAYYCVLCFTELVPGCFIFLHVLLPRKMILSAVSST